MKKTEAALGLAARAELPLLAAIQLEAATRFPEKVLPEPMRSSYTVPEEIMIEALGRGRLWVARSEENLPLGYALWRETGGAAILEQVDVLPAHGRRGIGGLLVRRIMKEAFRAGHARLYLTTFESVPWNGPFYLKLGFTIAADDDLPRPILEIIQQERKLIQNRIAMQGNLPDLLDRP